MKAPEPSVVDDPQDLTVEWLRAALDSSGHQISMDKVEVTPIGTGQMGSTYRLNLGNDSGTGPSSLVAKLAAGDAEARQMISAGYAAEVGFYRDIAPGADVDTPRCWYASITPDSTSFTLLLDDIAAAQPGVQAAGCTAEQAAAALANLVGLHAPYWNDVRLDGFDFLLRIDADSAGFVRELLVPATADFIARYDEIELAEADVLRQAALGIERWLTRDAAHRSVLHGDYRLDNLMFGPGATDVTAVDWQTATVGPPARDVAYFLGTSLKVDDRRRYEKDLVADYHRGLLDAGVVGYDASQCWDDYRLGQLQGPLITILGCMLATGTRSEDSDRMFLAMAHRSTAAIADLDSLALLED